MALHICMVKVLRPWFLGFVLREARTMGIPRLLQRLARTLSMRRVTFIDGRLQSSLSAKAQNVVAA
jgi:hypothetical protein